MEMGIIEIISSLGFPIACCVALFIQNEKQDVRHRDETEMLRNTIEKNTQILIELVAEIRKDLGGK